MKNYLSIIIITIVIIGCNESQIIAPQNHNSQTITIIQDEFQNTPIVIIQNKTARLSLAFQRNLKGELLHFEAIENQLPNIIKDQNNNIYDIWGTCIEGFRKGEQLEKIETWSGYWFAIAAFFQNAEIYGEALTFEPLPIDTPSNGWLINSQNIHTGTSKDAIVSIDNPTFYDASDFNASNSDHSIVFEYLSDTTKVIGLNINGDIRAYPHSVFNWVEIVNDEIGGEAISIIYCPLTGTSTAWSRNLHGNTTSFGVSGLVYNNNVIPYDRATDSYWSQIKSQCIYGQNIGMIPNTFPIVETTWKTWKTLYPNTKVLADITSKGHNCALHPYGNYETQPEVSYPLTFADERLFSKRKVFAVVKNGKARVYLD
jgi:hypothetical protein